MDLDRMLELFERIAGPKLVAIETSGTLNELDRKVRLVSETGRDDTGRSRDAPRDVPGAL
eukprot:6990876-Pyramimonas_sp.AAC.1